MVVSTKGKKRSLESADEDVAQKKKAKLGEWDPEAKEKFKKDHKQSCWKFAETGECSFGEDCRFSHVTRDGEMIQERKVKTKKKTVRKTKEELINEREMDEEGNSYTGTVKFYNSNREYGFITIEEDITFKDLTAKKKIYVMKEDIICESEEIGLNKGMKVVFTVYKDSMGLGAMDVTDEDGTPIVFETETEKVVSEKEPTPDLKPVESPPKKKTPLKKKVVKTMKSSTKKKKKTPSKKKVVKTMKSSTKKKAVKKRKSTKSKNKN